MSVDEIEEGIFGVLRRRGGKATRNDILKELAPAPILPPRDYAAWSALIGKIDAILSALVKVERLYRWSKGLYALHSRQWAQQFGGYDVEWTS